MVDPKLLKNLIPLHNLTAGNLERLAKRLRVEELPTGRVIFNEGDTDNDAVYLLEGGVELSSHETTMKRLVQGGTEEASYALAPTRPRPLTAKTTTKTKIVRIDNRKLDRAVVLDEMTSTVTNIYGVAGNEFGGDTVWLEQMLGDKIFSMLPSEKIAPLMLKMQPVSVKSGHIVFKQGDPGDYYYVVKKGRFNVSRKEKDGKVKILAELGPGSVFGEQSLISGDTQDASIIAMGPGTLMRLSKADFEDLLKKPLLRYVENREARKMVKGGAGLLDVRASHEYETGALKGSENFPINQLRDRANELELRRRYVLCCKTGVQSEVAAFLLRQRGFEVFVLKGGLQAIPRKG
jgi:CRP-like cAMP-binding protein